MSFEVRPWRSAPEPVRTAVAALYAGAGLTVLAVLVTIATSGALGRQLDALYPHDHDRAAMAESSILTYLFTLAVAGLVLWLVLSRAVRRGRRWARTAATVVFAVATALALYHFGQPHPLAMSLAWLPPSAAGLAAVALLWRPGAAGHFARPAG